MSLPTRERGLKSSQAPAQTPCSTSLPTRERGLKCRFWSVWKMVDWSLPTRERGLKYGSRVSGSSLMRRSLRGSVGLKYLLSPIPAPAGLSLPTRERGLKSDTKIITPVKTVAPYAGAWIEMHDGLIGQLEYEVAPYAGAWIEISVTGCSFRGIWGRSLRGSVD